MCRYRRAATWASSWLRQRPAFLTRGAWTLVRRARHASRVFNTVLGEELLFRGFLLPRMNGAFGRRDWAGQRPALRRLPPARPVGDPPVLALRRLSSTATRASAAAAPGSASPSTVPRASWSSSSPPVPRALSGASWCPGGRLGGPHPRARRQRPLAPGRAAGARAGAGRGPRPGVGVRRVPHRPARGRGRPARPPDRRRARPRGRRAWSTPWARAPAASTSVSASASPGCATPAARAGSAARGDENLCLTPRFTGWDEDGGYAEHAVVDERYAYRLPEAFTDEQAAPLLCAGIIGYRALRRAELPPGGRLGIYGFGGSAHLAAQVAMAEGATVFVMTRSAEARRLATDLGARVGRRHRDAPPEPLDSAICFAPAGELVPAALEALDRGGTLAIAGIHLSDVPALDYQRHLFQERQVRSVTANTAPDGEDFLAVAARIGDPVTTTPYPLDAADRALADLAHDRVDGAAVLRRSGHGGRPKPRGRPVLPRSLGGSWSPSPSPTPSGPPSPRRRRRARDDPPGAPGEAGARRLVVQRRPDHGQAGGQQPPGAGRRAGRRARGRTGPARGQGRDRRARVRQLPPATTPGCTTCSPQVVTEGADGYARPDLGGGTKVNVEFVSANPTGPLHAGHGRGAAYGDSLARLLERHRPRRRAGSSTSTTGAPRCSSSRESLAARKAGETPPEDGYQGEYIDEWAAEMPDDADPARVGRASARPGRPPRRSLDAAERRRSTSGSASGRWSTAARSRSTLADLRRPGVAYDARRRRLAAHHRRTATTRTGSSSSPTASTRTCCPTSPTTGTSSPGASTC